MHSVHSVTTGILAWVAGFVGLVGWGIGAGSVQAAQTLAPGDLLEGTNWVVTWSDTTFPSDVLKLEWNPATIGRTNQGTLTKTVTFPSLSPIIINFVQKQPTVPDEDAQSTFGLRFTLNEVVSNKSGSDWIGFREDLVDAATANQRVDFRTIIRNDQGGAALAGHPEIAHFHPDTNTGMGAIFFMPPFLKIDGGNTSDFVLASNGLFANGTTGVNWTGIGIHEWEIADTFRQFDLLETPIPMPEPSSWLLLGSGLAGLIVWRRKRGI